MKKIIMLFVAVFLYGSTVFAQTTEAYKDHPGYIDFGSFEQFQDAAKNVDISLKGPLLKLVSRAAAKKDPGLSALLNELVLIQVNVFSIKDDQLDEVNGIVQNASKTLTSKQWERIVRVHEGDQHVEIYIQFGDTEILNGLALIATGDDKKTPEKEQQAVFVNIAGNIDPEQLGKLGNKFNIPELDELSFGKSE